MTTPDFFRARLDAMIDLRHRYFSPLPVMRQQLPDATLRLRRQADEDILQIREGLMAIEAG